MMLQHKTLLSSLFLAAAALTLSACDDDPVDYVDCTVTPDHEECKTEVDCTVTPDHEDCKVPVDCNETPDHAECQTEVDCDETPDHELCQIECEDLDTLITEAIAPKSDVTTIAQPTVDQVNENYHILTFTAGGGQDPNIASRVYLDLDTSEFLELSDVDARTNTEWDIAFDAVGYVYTNSGQSGPGGLRVATIDNVADEDAFLALEQPGRDDNITWVQDTFIDKVTCDKITNRFIGVDFLQTAIGDWFEYNPVGHTVATKSNTYLIYNSADNHHIYKIKFLSYGAVSKQIELGVAEFVAPTEECVVDVAAAEALDPKTTAAVVPEIIVSDEGDHVLLTIDAALGGAAAAADSSWVYVDLRTSAIIEISDEDALTSTAWDLAFKRAEIRLNSKNSGPRNLRVAMLENVLDFVNFPEPAQGDVTWLQDTFIDAETCEPITYGQGALQTALGQWYDYDMSTHVISAPEEVAYMIYDGAAGHARYKFQIVSYANGLYEIAVKEYPAFQPRP